MSKRSLEIDTAATTRIVAILRCILENPDVYTKRNLCDMFGVADDTMKNYFNSIRIVGFDLVHSDYPDYTYSIDNFNTNKMKITKDFLSKYSSKRHNESFFMNINRSSGFRFSAGFVTKYDINEETKLDFELVDEKVFLKIDKKGIFNVTKANKNAFDSSLGFNSSELSRFLFDFYGKDMKEVTSFRVHLVEIEKNKFELKVIE